MMQYTVDVFPAVLDWLFHSEFPRLFVFVLQFWESQSHAANADFIRAFGG